MVVHLAAGGWWLCVNELDDLLGVYGGWRVFWTHLDGIVLIFYDFFSAPLLASVVCRNARAKTVAVMSRMVVMILVSSTIASLLHACT